MPHQQFINKKLKQFVAQVSFFFIYLFIFAERIIYYVIDLTLGCELFVKG